MNKILNPIARFFKFEERSATFKKELIGGLSTFLAMAYILGVNPSILNDTTPSGKPSLEGAFFLGTALSAVIGSMLMGMFANVPIGMAPGMGANVFFAYTVAGPILNLGLSSALVATFVSGILYVIIAITPARRYISKLLPRNMKLAIGAMIGLFLAYIGLMDTGIIVSDASITDGVLRSHTGTKLGDFSNPLVIIAAITIIIVFVLHYMNIKGAVIIAMLLAVAMLGIASAAGSTAADNAFEIKSYDSFDRFDDAAKDMWTSFGSSFKNGKFYIAVFVFLYVDFFDTTGTIFSVGEQAGLNKDPEKAAKWMRKANIVSAVSTMTGSVFINSTNTTYIESSVGVSQGAKTGLSSVFVAIGFALSIAIWPIMSPIMPIQVGSAVPADTGQFMPVTGPVLVLVGSIMIAQLKSFNWAQTIDIPTLFVTSVFGMLGNSISTGIAAGIIMHFAMNTSAWLISAYKEKHGKELIIDDETIDFAGTKDIKQKNKKSADYRQRVLNPVMFIA